MRGAEMREPWRSRFVALVAEGAAARDIHDSDGRGDYDSEAGTFAGSQRFIQREIERVQVHLRGMCALLRSEVAPGGRVLDVGCGTGGTSVALALSPLAPREVVGIDASASALEAARVRACGHDLASDRLRFVHVPVGEAFPFQDASFDLVTCVSVLEFIGSDAARRAFVAEMLRVTRPGGHTYVATPNPLRLREHHSRRWLGDWLRKPGYPWSSPAHRLHAMFGGCRVRSLARERVGQHRWLRHAAFATFVLGMVLPWQRVLAHKPPPPHSTSTTLRRGQARLADSVLAFDAAEGQVESAQ